GYQDLMVWLDMLPPNTELKDAYAELFVDQVAGLYDSDTKEMCIPSAKRGKKVQTKPAEKKLQKYAAFADALVFAHEYTHALEDQYWVLDDPEEKKRRESTDRGAAHSFLFEGSATRMMLEAIPAQSGRLEAAGYIRSWNLLHAAAVEAVLDYALSHVWKSSDAKVAGVPESLSRSEAMPYSYGYHLCRKILDRWGLDGLDYIYSHPPASTEQVMHWQKSWEWRDFPVAIRMPETLAGGWKQLAGDSLGEAGIAVLFGCQFKNLDRGLRLARGWDGDRAALYEANSHRLLVWASAWDSTSAAEHYATAWLEERLAAHNGTIMSQRDQR